MLLHQQFEADNVLSNYLENDLLIFCWFVIYKTKTLTWTPADLIALKCK